MAIHPLIAFAAGFLAADAMDADYIQRSGGDQGMDDMDKEPIHQNELSGSPAETPQKEITPEPTSDFGHQDGFEAPLEVPLTPLPEPKKSRPGLLSGV